jgi:hypothetical protein
LKAASILDPQRLKDRSVIFLFMHGGPSQYETFDPKMEAPSHIRSATGAIATKIPGIYFGSTFRQLAERADLFSTVRSFVPGDANHDIKPIVSSASFRCSLGSIYSRVAGAVRSETAIPTAALIHPRSVQPEAGPMITEFGNLAASGDLGAQYAPFIPGAGAGLQEDMQLHLPLERLADRRSLLEQLDQQRRRIESISASDSTPWSRRYPRLSISVANLQKPSLASIPNRWYAPTKYERSGTTTNTTPITLPISGSCCCSLGVYANRVADSLRSPPVLSGTCMPTSITLRCRKE